MEPRIVPAHEARTVSLHDVRCRYGLTILDDWSSELQARYRITL
ncbi:MAG TPA: hypothetical protein VHK06_06080 [Candidatus Limnocylindria bacterium]|nr:hypothetical protein [Candidatus Limnocylindria bacterium]